MNGYVELSFSKNEDATKYLFGIPNYIDFEVVANNHWVVVEDAFFDKKYSTSPYKIAYIRSFSKDNPRSYEPLKYITEVIRGNEYKAVKDDLQESTDLNNFFKKLPISIKRAIRGDVENGRYE